MLKRPISVCLLGFLWLAPISPGWAMDACIPSEPPKPIDSPKTLGTLPITPLDWTVAIEERAAERLAQTAQGFASRAPAWSLAVAGPTLGDWHATIGADHSKRFAAASIGKSMTAVLVFQQIEAGHLALSDTIERWFPELPDANTVTIDHLLTHRSGYVVPAQGPLSGAYQTPESTFEALLKTGSSFCPGQGWMYSNVGYQLLGRILETVSGKTYVDLLSEKILIPLGLEDTHVLLPSQPDQQMVRGHHGGQRVGDVDYATPFAAAPVSSTAVDLIRYWHGLLTGSLINADSLNRMVTPAFSMFGDPRMRYGAGMQVAQIDDGPGAMLMHSGGITGFSATVAWLPEHQLFVAVMVNERQVPAEAALWALVRGLIKPDMPRQ